MYFEDSWGMVSLPASDIQAIIDTLQDAIEQLTSAVEHTTADAIADKLVVALDLVLGTYC